MPPSPPPDPTISEKADRYIVLLGPTDGTAPSLENECDWLIAQEVSISAGGDRLDTIKCKIDFGVDGAKRLQDTTSPVRFHRQVEIRRVDDEGEPTEVVAWGMIASDMQSIDHEEREMIVARLDHFLFGGVLKTTTYWDSTADEGEEIKKVHLPCVFNPEIDDKFEPNMSDKTSGEDTGDYHLFLHPESHRLQGAVTLQDQEASEWTLKTAAHWLIWTMNPDETYITNPTLEEMGPAFESEAEFARVRNVEIKFGQTLPQALDHLLKPFGYGWQVVHNLAEAEDGDSPAGEEDVEDATAEATRETTFRFFELGKGPIVHLMMQKIGESINFDETNLAQFKLDYDISKLANKIIGRGGFKLYESTFDLVPAWLQEFDDTDIEKLEIGQPDFITKQDVLRKFVLNEAGDYIWDSEKNRTHQWITEISDELDGLLNGPDSDNPDPYIIRRRRFRKCISQHESGDDETSNGFVLEWWDKDQPEADTAFSASDPGWVKVKHAFQVLEKECGIMFKTPTPPAEFQDLLTEDPTTQKLYLRITCCIESDVRLEQTAEQPDPATSPNGENLELLLELKDRFKYRHVFHLSRFDGVGTPDEKDDTEDLMTYVEKVRDNNDQAEVSLSVMLMTSNHPEYKIGQIIDKVDGRNLTFNANSSESATPRLLQIMGFNRTLDGEQRTEVLLETFELERRELLVSL